MNEDESRDKVIKVAIEGKVIKVRSYEDRYYLRIEIDKNGIEKNTNTANYYKLLLAENGNNKHCVQKVEKDEDYYYVEILVLSTSPKVPKFIELLKSPKLLKSLESQSPPPELSEFIELLKSPELLKSLESSQSICPLEICSVIGKRIKIKFECKRKNPSTPNKTQIENKIVEYEIYE